MQEFGRLSMLSDYFLWSGHAQKRLCGSHDPVHLVFGAIWWEMFKIVYPPIPSYHYTNFNFHSLHLKFILKSACIQKIFKGFKFEKCLSLN